MRVVATTVRYHTPDKDGETRAQRNARFGFHEKTPAIKPPRHCAHVLQWFWELSEARAYGQSGPCRLSAAEISAWFALTGNIATREEIRIIQRIDAAYVAAVNAEIADQMARNKDKGGES